MKFSIGLIIVIILLGFFTIKSIFNITMSLKNQEPITKYGKNRINKDEDKIYEDLNNENEKYERRKKPNTYSRMKTIEINDEKYSQAKRYSNRIKITSLIGWVIAISILMIYYIKNFRK